jgi:hypothetical protein
MIKYINWSIENILDIHNKETAIERWENFLKSAPENVVNTVT